jgi:hypothetical protein
LEFHALDAGRTKDYDCIFYEEWIVARHDEIDVAEMTIAVVLII